MTESEGAEGGQLTGPSFSSSVVRVECPVRLRSRDRDAQLDTKTQQSTPRVPLIPAGLDGEGPLLEAPHKEKDEPENRPALRPGSLSWSLLAEKQ